MTKNEKKKWYNSRRNKEDIAASNSKRSKEGIAASNGKRSKEQITASNSKRNKEERAISNKRDYLKRTWEQKQKYVLAFSEDKEARKAINAKYCSKRELKTASKSAQSDYQIEETFSDLF